MKQTLFVGLFLLTSAFAANAQTMKLPTKKTNKKVETKGSKPTRRKEKTLVMPTKSVKEQAKASTQTATQTVEISRQDANQAAEISTSQNGTLALPTVAREKTLETTDVTTAAKTPEMINGVPQLPVIVHRQEAPRAKSVIPKKPKVEDNEIYESAEHMPTYPGGAVELMNFINENLQYPEEALNDSVQGIVQVSFIVEKDGSTTDFEVIDEHHPALEAEAVRVLQQMPKWKPATQNGVKVRVEYVVPVKFTMSNQQ